MLSFVEADKREPSIGVLKAIGRALDIPASVLFAVALDDVEVGQGTRMADKVHELTQHIFEAARHSLAARRHGDQSKSRRSA
jgi:transcriptional regulator with XRE-family HTH domain